jgi:hypothetical protein
MLVSAGFRKTTVVDAHHDMAQGDRDEPESRNPADGTEQTAARDLQHPVDTTKLRATADGCGYA